MTEMKQIEFHPLMRRRYIHSVALPMTYVCILSALGTLHKNLSTTDVAMFCIVLLSDISGAEAFKCMKIASTIAKGEF